MLLNEDRTDSLVFLWWLFLFVSANLPFVLLLLNISRSYQLLYLSLHILHAARCDQFCFSLCLGVGLVRREGTFKTDLFLLPPKEDPKCLYFIKSLSYLNNR